MVQQSAALLDEMMGQHWVEQLVGKRVVYSVEMTVWQKAE
jgi:hypothetical protein